MEKVYRDGFLAWAGTTAHRNVVEQAKEIIIAGLAKYRRTYVSFSGGKDSLAMLHLILAYDSEIMVMHWDYGPYFMPRPVLSETLALADKLNVCLRVETSPQYEQLGRQAFNIWGRDFLAKLTPILRQDGYEAVFVGLRAEESLGRRRRLLAGRSLGAMPEMWPLMYWRWQDVWAYLLSCDLPYHPHYDWYGPLVGWDKVRFSTFFDRQQNYLGCANVDGMLMWRHRYLEKKTL
jgi:3'-phosphoadenosine 5'-phosphosulfate sulfotransferase (PAPS reductase)/FAD synthetase